MNAILEKIEWTLINVATLATVMIPNEWWIKILPNVEGHMLFVLKAISLVVLTLASLERYLYYRKKRKEQ